jgi:hypothetical protein
MQERGNEGGHVGKKRRFDAAYRLVEGEALLSGPFS